MTYEDKVRYLRSYRDAVAEISRLDAEIARWRSLAEKVTPSLSLAPGGGDSDRIASAVERIADCTAARERELDVLCCFRDEIGRNISTVHDERLARLLRLRYIDCLRLEEIAMRENLDFRWTRRLMHRAIDKLTL